ncbi:hypothetical protein V2J09_022188 [Rumex salicifolius]
MKTVAVKKRSSGRGENSRSDFLALEAAKKVGDAIQKEFYQKEINAMVAKRASNQPLQLDPTNMLQLEMFRKFLRTLESSIG